MLQKLFGRTFELTFVGLVLATLASLGSFFAPAFHAVIFFAILAAVLVLGIRRFDIAFYVLLAELFAGSQGRLFSTTIGGFSLSLRMGLFAVVMLLWLVFRARHDIGRIFRSPIGWWLFVLTIVIGLGVVLALANENALRFLYLDVNGMLYVLGAVFFFSAIRSRQQLPTILSLLAASIAFQALFALTLFIFFSHGSQFVPEVYRWVRDTRMFEITGLGGRYYRIFSQAHIFALLGGFVFAGLFADAKEGSERRHAVIIMIIASFVLVVGFSRSFLSAAVASFLVLLAIVARTFHWKSRRTVGFAAATALVIAVNAGLLFTIAATIGKTGFQVSLTAFEDRVSDPSQVGFSSRYKLLRPLLTAALDQPITGKGWGSAITYRTTDPRIVAATGGSYTTFAFEWGYLDLLLKIGAIGLAVFAGLFLAMLREQRFLMRRSSSDRGLLTGFVCATIALFLTHAVTPFLNHPSGLGFLLLTAATLLVLRHQRSEKPPT